MARQTRKKVIVAAAISWQRNNGASSRVMKKAWHHVANGIEITWREKKTYENKAKIKWRQRKRNHSWRKAKPAKIEMKANGGSPKSGENQRHQWHQRRNISGIRYIHLCSIQQFYAYAPTLLSMYSCIYRSFHSYEQRYIPSAATCYLLLCLLYLLLTHIMCLTIANLRYSRTYTRGHFCNRRRRGEMAEKIIGGKA